MRLPLAGASLALCCCLALAPPAASAQAALRWMQDTPLAQFSDEDVRLMNAAIQQALDSGDPAEWKNDETDSGGTATPSASPRADCRMLVVENRHEQKVASTKFQFCKVQDAWKVVP